MHRWNLIILLVLLSLAIHRSFAEGPGDDDFNDPNETLSESPSIYLNDIYAKNFPGESVSLQTGELLLTYTDARIPGPRGLDIELKRFHSSFGNPAELFQPFGVNWTLDIPKIKTIANGEPGAVGYQQFMNCSINSLQVFADGHSLSKSSGLSSTSQLADGVTSNSLYLDGGYILNGCDNNYELLTPDGRKITFIAFSHYYPPGSTTSNPTYEVKLFYVDRVEDRFGNYLQYDYERITLSTNGRTFYNVPLLSSISNSEGSSLTINYVDKTNFPKVSTVNYNGKTISYTYAGTSGNFLHFVEDAEGQKAEFEWDVFTGDYSIQKNIVSAVYLPSGITSNYVYKTLADNSLGATVCSAERPCAPCPLGCVKPVLESSTIDGVGLTTKFINYSRTYNTNTIDVVVNESEASSSRKTVEQYKRVIHNDTNIDNGSIALDGVLNNRTVYDGNTKLYELNQFWTYQVLGSVGCYRFSGTGDENCAHPRLYRKTESYYNEGGSDTYHTEYSQFDEYDFPQITYEHNSFNSKKLYIKNSYFHDLNHWLLALPVKVEISTDGISYSESKRTTYYGSTHNYKSLPKTLYANGRWYKNYISYHTSGTHKGLPKDVNINESNDQIQLSNYKRGRPQTIRKKQPLGTSYQYGYQTVNNEGLITKRTDYEGNCSSFSYDDIGRLSNIIPCDTKWLSTTIDYELTADNEGYPNVEAGMLKQSVSRGNYRAANYYDSFLRLVFSIEWDNSSKASTIKYSSKKYNHDNLLTFIGYPNINSSVSWGINYEYDALGRKILETDNTTSASINYSYLNDNRVSKTDGEGNITKTTYMAYGQPTKDKPLKIESPESTVTTFSYNIFGNTISITQDNLTEARVYNDYQDLCKVIRADIGNSSYAYDGHGRLSWFAHGNSITSDTTSCQSTVDSNEKVSYTYDNHSNVSSIGYGDGSSTKNFTYDKNDRILSDSAGNISSSYHYNSAGLLETESKVISGASYTFEYSFNNLQHISALKYSDGEQVSYAPNALGQPTKVGSYATNAEYHPNGQLSQFIYGNGYTHVLTQYNNGLPKDYYDIKGSSVAIDHYIEFDNNNNLTYLRDDQNSLYNIDITYDGLDRIDDINDSFFGSGSVSYDSMGNILNYTLGNENTHYNYDSNTRRLNSTTGSNSYNISYDERGNIINNGSRSFSFNLAQQLISSSSSGNTINFSYDANNKRTIKTQNGLETIFFYSKSGRILFKRQPDNKVVNFLYLKDKLVAKNEKSVEVDPLEPIENLTIDGDIYSLYSTEQNSILFSQNLDTDSNETMTWNVMEGSTVIFEYKINFGTSGYSAGNADVPWTFYNSFSTNSGELYYDIGDINESRVPRHSYNSTSTDYAKLYLRIKVQNDSGSSDWRYLKPIWVYYND